MIIFKLKPNAINLAEGNAIPKAVQLLRTGSFKHDVYGTFEITTQILSDLVKNFVAKVRGVDPAIDYAHESDKVAAGWITGLELADDGQSLWAQVDWTPKGKGVLESKEYRYLSSDFTFNYEDSETGQKFGPVLFGAGLTNRPFIKGMSPAVELSEITKGEPMKTVEQLEKEVKKLSEDLKASQDKVAEMKAALPAPAAPGAMSIEDAMKKIEELNAQIEALKSEKEMGAKAAEAAKVCAEKKEKFDVMLKEGKVVEAQRKAFMEDNFNEFVKLTETVKLNPKGSGGDGKADDEEDEKDSATPAQDEVVTLAEKLVAEKKASDIGVATSMILNDPKNKELAKKARLESGY